ncbi:GNAT family N-acetyltransferase [Leifsonia sp. NPDC080035]|uniref:GNAT family N-acetyltransferase n=1 Tax=Leifsonia sp. NPDC080035 TaxID=3143936 RepID=A0AAU7GB36_9MICO
MTRGPDRPEPAIAVHRHDTAALLAALGPFFDAEYNAEFGAWEPQQPYGYAPFDVRVVARMGTAVVGHAGFQRRVIAVGDAEVVVGGTGGVLIAPEQRGTGLGRRLMRATLAAMRDALPVDFGYLGCREEVAGFYESVGWTRVRVAERSVSARDGRPVHQEAGPPILIAPASRAVVEWPTGPVDLRGRPW